MIEGPTPRSSGLDAAPPGASPKRASLMALTGSGMGMEAGNPQVRALRGMKGVEMAFQDLVAAIPELAPQAAEIIGQLEQVVAQFVSGSAGAGALGAPPPPMM